MSEESKGKLNLGLVIGTLGFLAGIFLLFTDSWLIGLFGSIASAGIAYQGYRDRNKA